MRNLFVIALALVLTACQTTTPGLSGAVNPFPEVRTQAPAHVRVYRVAAGVLTASQKVTLTINGREIYNFKNGERVDFDMDPGEYRFGARGIHNFRMETVNNEIYAYLEAGRSYSFQINPSMYSHSITRSNN